MHTKMGFPFYPYVVAHEKEDGSKDCFYCETRQQAQDFVKQLGKEYKVKVYKLKAKLLYFRAGRKRRPISISIPTEQEHEIDPSESFV